MKAYEYLSLLSYERALKNERAKSKIVEKLFLNCTFGQDSSFISDLARPNSNKTVLVHFVFCMMSSFCSMGQVARWTLAREMIKGTNVFYPICSKKHWKKLDRQAYLKWIRHLARNLRKVLNEVWQDKKLRKIWRNSCFKLKQMNYINCRNKEHMK